MKLQFLISMVQLSGRRVSVSGSESGRELELWKCLKEMFLKKVGCFCRFGSAASGNTM